jgi:hypothetical protein
MLFGLLAHVHEPLAISPASPRDDGAYLTDGRRLFRVVAPLHTLERRDVAILEDCSTLNVNAFTADELYSMRLTRVVPACERRLIASIAPLGRRAGNGHRP